MNIIEKIKINYYQKLFQDFIDRGDYEGFQAAATDLYKSNKSLFSIVPKNFLKNLLIDSNSYKFFKKNIIWLNSYQREDLNKINDFLKFYIDDDFKILEFVDEIYKSINDLNLSKQKKLSFDDFVSFNQLLQFCISQKYIDTSIFLNNESAFFEIPDLKNLFTFTNLTSNFIYVVRNPLEIYADQVNFKNNLGKEEAINNIVNTNIHFKTYVVDDFEIDQNTQSWNINVKSWTSDNVINTYNGLVVQHSDLENNNIDTYAEIIAHLNQAGLNIPLDYDKIKQFFEQIKISNKINYKDFEISNQIKKIIERDCKEMMKKFNYLS